MHIFLCLAAAAAALYTQLAHMTSVPGLHFDEAWQGLFAHRIATEAGFFPTSAMNSYTSPVLHYVLAGVFKLFGPTLAAMRGTFAAMNLSTMALIGSLLWKLGERRGVAWFILLWALLPLNVHNHRFYVEVTGFHGLCLALVLWGVALWSRSTVLSTVLITLGIVAGTYSHILFIAVFLAGLLVLARSFPSDFRSARAKWLVAVIALMLVPLPVRMGLGLKKLSPFVLAAGLCGVALWAAAMQNLWITWPRRALRISRFVPWLSLPFLIAFVALMWNGFWPYAQATGKLRLLWLPLNAAIFAGLVVLQYWRRASALFEPRIAPRSRMLLSPSLTWGAFLATFLITSILILKQSPRYYTVPTILAVIWAAQRLGRVRRAWVHVALASSFVVWNLSMFEIAYVRQYQLHGSNTREFKLWIFHDNGRDFRPFQKLLDWGLKTNCLHPTPWVEDDRFKLPIDFLRLTAPAPADVKCPYDQGDLFYSHIPNYDPALDGNRNEHNTPPPVENVKFLEHFPDWGDLAVWIRR